MKTLYDILGVKEDATTDEIRAAFRKLAKKFHPDVNPDPQAVEVMKLLVRAYEVLSDPSWRAQYDAKLARLRAPAILPQEMVVNVVMPGGGWMSGVNSSVSSTSTTTGFGASFFFYP